MAVMIVSDLYFACRDGDKATVERLLPQTPLRLLNRLEPNGSTCLHVASYNGHTDIVRMLLEYGACRRIINRYGCTPLDEAKTKEIAQLFPRSAEATKQRFSNNPVEQPEWNFEDNSAEYYSRATHWGCLKDRGIKKTIKKLDKALALLDDREKSTALVKDLFQQALETNDPIYLLRAYTGLISMNSAFEPDRLTYRGMQITSTDYEQYQIGFGCLSVPRPGKLSVVIIFTIIDKKSALNIDQISEYQHEEEVLILLGTLFIVTNINKTTHPYEINLEQLKWDDEF
ncbi:hypothetical protein I4U23_027807 [Adineta vaga]|nr:hypothetical protein I4U23_027807 [Adineta vaga]